MIASDFPVRGCSRFRVDTSDCRLRDQDSRELPRPKCLSSQAILLPMPFPSADILIPFATTGYFPLLPQAVRLMPSLTKRARIASGVAGRQF